MMDSFLDTFARPRDIAVPADPADEAAARLRLEADDARKDNVTTPAPPEKPQRVITDLPDGGKEYKNIDGSIVVADKQGLVRKITRTDGSAVECFYNGNVMNKIQEVRKGKITEWNKDAAENRWRSMDYVGSQRIAFTVNNLGQSWFDDVLGTRYVTNGDTSQTRYKADRSVIEIDKNWHVTTVTRPDKSKLLCGYTNNQLSEITERTTTGDVVWKYDGGRDEWTSPSSTDVRKSVSVSDLGNYAYISARSNDVVHIDYLDGNKRDFEHDKGRVNKIIEHTPSGQVTWQRDGDTDTFVSGNTKEKREQVAVSLNGDYSYLDSKGYKHIHKFDVTEEVILPTNFARAAEVEKERTELVKEAGALMAADKLAHFTADVDRFEQRAHTAGMKHTQVAETLAEIRKILTSTAEKPVIKDRVKLAQEAMFHVANPRGVDQGMHDSCGAASAQVFVCALYPEKFAALVRQVADTGQYATHRGLVVKPQAESLLPDREAAAYTPYDSRAWGRTFASQIYQVVGINAAYDALGNKYRYQQGRPTHTKDTGERLVDRKTNAYFEFKGLFDNEVKEITRQTCGQEIPILRRGTHFHNEDQLKQQVADLQKKNLLPSVLCVHTKNEPFWSAAGSGRSGSPGGGHYVTLWDIDNSQRVLLDNQWGKRGDYESLRRLPISTVFGATDR
jgi:hypothetical protein